MLAGTVSGSVCVDTWHDGGGRDNHCGVLAFTELRQGSLAEPSYSKPGLL